MDGLFCSGKAIKVKLKRAYWAPRAF